MKTAAARPTFLPTPGLTGKPFHYCPGCSHGVIHRLVAETLVELGVLNRAIGVASVGCSTFAEQYFNCDVVGAPHGRAPAVATGIRRTVPDAVVFTYQGDGDLASIGLGEVLHAAVRSEKITVIFVNNAIYGMTGGQMAPTTLIGQRTTTTPAGRQAAGDGFPLDVPKLLQTIPGVSYLAAGATDSPKAIIQAKTYIRRAFETQIRGQGFALVSLLANCPTNWGMTPAEANRWMRSAMVPQFVQGELRISAGQAGARAQQEAGAPAAPADKGGSSR